MPGPGPTTTLRKRRGAWVLAGLALVLWGWLHVGTFWDAPGDDFSSWVVAAQVLKMGQSEHLYDHHPVLFHVVDSPAFTNAAQAVGFRGFLHPYVHPPLLAKAIAPLTSLGFESLRRAWLIVTALASLAALGLTLHLYAPARTRCPGVWALLLVALCIFQPLRYGLWLGQTTPVIWLLMLLAIWQTRKGHSALAGIVLAPAVFLKITPVLLGLLWLWRGPKRAFWSMVAVLIGLSALSWVLCGATLNKQYLSVVRHASAHTLVSWNNHSFLAYLTRYAVDLKEVFNWAIQRPPIAIKLAHNVVSAVALSLVCWRLHRIPKSDARFAALSENMAFAFMLFVPSIAWTHYFVLLLPMWATLYALTPHAENERGARAASLGIVAASFSLCSLPFAIDPVSPRVDGNIVYAGPTFALLLTLGLLFRLAWRAGDRAPTAAVAVATCAGDP